MAIRGIPDRAAGVQLHVTSLPGGRLGEPARDFVRQYISCTPLMAVLLRSNNTQTEALEQEMEAAWSPWASNGGLRYQQSTLFSTARTASLA